MLASYTCCHCARYMASTFWPHLPNMSHVEHIVNFPADSQLTASCHLAAVELRLQHHFRLATLLLIYIFITCRSDSRSSSSRLCSIWKSSCRSREHSVCFSFCFCRVLPSAIIFCRFPSHTLYEQAGELRGGKGKEVLRTCTSLALVAAN